jgi:protein-S-isoprenylcysteine O-methyltransferase Ste14
MSELAVRSKTPAGVAWLRPAVLDRAEQVLILALWAFLVQRVVYSDNVFAPLLVLSETAVVVFVLIRRPTQTISLRLGDWLLAITATLSPLLITPGAQGPVFLTIPAIVLIGGGNCMQLWAKLSLRRSFGIAPANRGIKVSGPYRFVRHPMYAGYLATHIGLFMVMPSLLNLALYFVAWWSQILRLLAEERLLSQDPAYREFKEVTPYRLVPGVF